MERDFRFQFDKARVFSGWAGLTARRAVLRPLFGKAVGRTEVVKQTRNCLFAWRSRVSELSASFAACSRRHDWEQNTRNCQPAFVVLPGKSWACAVPTICPFCYARAVAQLWTVAERSFMPYFDMATSPYWLLERRYRSPVAFADATMLRYNYQFAAEKRRQLFKHYGAIGGYGCLRVEPTTSPVVWSFSGRQLFKVPANGSYRAVMPKEIITIHETPTRALLSAALARTCRYPKLLLRAPVADVVPILDFQTRSRVRLSALFGDFRSGSDECG